VLSEAIFNSTAHPMTPPTFTIKSDKERIFFLFIIPVAD